MFFFVGINLYSLWRLNRKNLYKVKSKFILLINSLRCFLRQMYLCGMGFFSFWSKIVSCKIDKDYFFVLRNNKHFMKYIFPVFCNIFVEDITIYPNKISPTLAFRFSRKFIYEFNEIPKRTFYLAVPMMVFTIFLRMIIQSKSCCIEFIFQMMITPCNSNLYPKGLKVPYIRKPFWYSFEWKFYSL